MPVPLLKMWELASTCISGRSRMGLSPDRKNLEIELTSWTD
jgi:hypothetical protein